MRVDLGLSVASRAQRGGQCAHVESSFHPLSQCATPFVHVDGTVAGHAVAQNAPSRAKIPVHTDAGAPVAPHESDVT